MAHFPAFSPLITDMQQTGSDREHFQVRYAQVLFDVIISIDLIPHEILIGARGINWACTMEISDDYEIVMPDNSFFQLRANLDLSNAGVEKFGSYIFLKYIATHSPPECSKFPVQPHIMQFWYPNRINNIDPSDRTVFYRWVCQTAAGRQAHNFEKTRVYFGNNVADYCIRHNISSQWITPEQAQNLQNKTVTYPWG